MKQKIEKYIAILLSISLIILIVSIIFIIVFTASTIIMKPFGLEYKSKISLILFFLISGVLSFPLELLAKGVPNALLSLNKINLNYAKILFLFFNIIATSIAMKITDYYMITISTTNISILIFAIFASFFGLADIRDDYNK